MARVYSVSVSAAASAAQDVFEITSASTKLVIVHSIVIAQSASSVSQQLRVTIQRATASGSGGTTPTARPLNPSDTAFAGTVEANNTSRATGLTLLHTEGLNSLNGWQWWPSPDDRIVIAPSALVIVGLETAPSPSLTLEATIYFEELG